MKTKLAKITAGTLLASLLIGATTAIIFPDAQITFIVKDDFGKPVPNVEVRAFTFSHWTPGEGFGESHYNKLSAKTDIEGKVVISGKSRNGDFDYGILTEKKYYPSSGEYKFKEKKAGRWEPWNPIVEIICKPILNPIPMYQGSGRHQLPAKGKEFGFDLSKNDFIAPFGRGVQTDIIFKLEEKIPYESAFKPYDYRLKISFPNKGDGIQIWQATDSYKGAFIMPRYAPTGGYKDNLELKYGRDDENYFHLYENDNYFIRVRTIRDKDGKVTSNLYGKIVGKIDFWRNGIMQINYYLNPTPMDVNMEHDPEKNLIPKKEH